MKLKKIIATFTAVTAIISAAPISVLASDAVIDSRNTQADNLVITEAEGGLFEEGKKIILALEKIEFEKDVKCNVIKGDIEVEAEITDKNGLKRLADVSEDDLKKYPSNCSYIVITILDESTEASVIEISGLKLYLDRTIPKGGYALNSVYTGNGMWENSSNNEEEYDKNGVFKYEPLTVSGDYVNVITSGRDTDDSTVKRKIEVTIGAEKMRSGDNSVVLDSPAYINEDDFTMLPIRAVAEALDTTVSWDDATKTVSLLRGQRIISFVVGSSEMYINGTKVPIKTKVEMKDGRAFLPLRDAADALGISDINWDEKTKTITLN